jgi:hypothetical protein
VEKDQLAGPDDDLDDSLWENNFPEVGVNNSTDEYWQEMRRSGYQDHN